MRPPKHSELSSTTILHLSTMSFTYTYMCEQHQSVTNPFSPEN